MRSRPQGAGLKLYSRLIMLPRFTQPNTLYKLISFLPAMDAHLISGGTVKEAEVIRSIVLQFTLSNLVVKVSEP